MTPSPVVAAAVDPTLLAVLSIFGGAALTALAGFIGAGVQARREHRAWLRQRRYEAFVAIKVYTSDMIAMSAELQDARATGDPVREDAAIQSLAELRARVSTVMAPMVVLGPEDVNEAGSQLVAAIRDDGDIELAQVAFATEMQRALNIRD